MPLIAWAISALATLFKSRIGQWAAMVLVFLGIELAASTIVMDPLVTYVQGAFSGMPGTMTQWLGYLNLDRYISILLSAYVTAAAAGAISMRRRAT